MLDKIQKKLLCLIILFFLTTIFATFSNTSHRKRVTPKLTKFFETINGYKKIKLVELENKAYQMLKLDDYIYANFEKGNDQVNLYIGYYYSPGKAYASHSPTVCYPSQGWKIDKTPISDSIDIGDKRINFKEVVTSYGNEKELVLYWYQTRLYTNTQIYKNKIDMAFNKMLYNDEHHAFVRVSVPFMNKSYAEAKMTAVSFINAFYPKFVEYLTENESM